MELPVVISHGDADGIICVALFLKENKNCRIHFTSSARLRDTLCYSIVGKRELKQLYIFDIAANEKNLKLASLFENVLWIDHHIWDVENNFYNVKVFVDSKALSCAQLVSKYFGVESELVDIANQIDRNEIKSEEAKFFRDFIAAIRWKFRGKILSSKFRSIARNLSLYGIEKFERDEKVSLIINEYYKEVEKIEKEIEKRVKIFETNKKRVAIYESMEEAPIYLISNKLLEHEKAPFDVIAVLSHRMNFITKNISTKIELRTHTNQNVYEIAKFFGGGGHKVASGATIKRFLTSDKLLEIIKSFL